MDSEKTNPNISFFIPTIESAGRTRNMFVKLLANENALVRVAGDLLVRIRKQI